MTLVAEDSTRGALVALLINVVTPARVMFRKYVHLNGQAVEFVYNRLHDLTAKRKVSAPWLTKRAVSEFLKDQLEAMIAESGTHQGAAGLLVDAAGFEDAKGLSERLATSLMTLPWRYRLMLPLPFGSDAPGNSLQISLDANSRIETFDDESAARIRLRDVDEAQAQYFHQQHPNVIATDTAYFIAEVSGYIPATDYCSSVEEFVHTWKGLIGLLTADFSLVRSPIPESGAPSPVLPVVIHRLIDDNAGDVLPYKWLSLEDTAILRRFGSADRITSDFVNAIRAIVPAFVHVPTRSAARWYVDSLSEQGSVLQIVQATISLEILLGDEREADEVGVTALLANRLAFLVEKTPRGRDAVLKRFKRLYGIRSKIVHAGKASLTDDERTALSELQELSHRALYAQISGLRSDARAPS